MELSRRRFIKMASGLLVAPAIVKAENIMRVKPVVVPEDGLYEIWYDIQAEMNRDLAEHTRQVRNELMENMIPVEMMFKHLPMTPAPGSTVTFKRTLPY